MHYQILANKWRPKIFSDVIGQEHIISSLKNSLLKNKVHHAYLLSGTRGVGKTTIARLLAKGLNCKKNNINLPCGICNNCIEIEQNKFVDLIEVDAASRTKIEDMRELLDNIQYLPSKGYFKIYLIDEVHMLSRYSFNALLKTLEEPPKHVKFLLATTEPQKVPITILSRCFQLHLKSINKELIFKHLEFILKNEKILIENDALDLIAEESHGSLRDALTLIDQVITINKKLISFEDVKIMLGVCDKNQVLDLIEAIITANSKKLMYLLKDLFLNNTEWDSLLIEMLKILHKISIIQILPNIKTNKLNNMYEKRILKLSQNINPEDIQLYYQIILIGRKEINFFPDHKTGFEVILIRLLAFNIIEIKKNKFDFKNNLITEKVSLVNDVEKNKKDNLKKIDILKLQEDLKKSLKNNFFEKKK